MSNNIITLRIFSGVHLGAEISLPYGNYSIGKDDSADIILQDQSLGLRHIMLEISEAKNSEANLPYGEASATIKVVLLDGEISSLDGELESESILEPRTPYYIGQTCFAFTEFGSLSNVWNAVATSFQQSLQHSTEKNQAEQEGIKDEASIVGSEQSVNANNVDSDNEAIVENFANLEKKSNEKKHNFQKYLVILVCLVLIASLTITANETFTLFSNNYKILEAHLEESGYTNLRIIEDGQGLKLQGVVKNDAERGQLLLLAQSLHFPVYMDVTVQNDLAMAIEKAYNSQGFYPEVIYDEDKNAIVINSYLKDRLTFFFIDQYIKDNLLDLGDKNLNYNIHYAEEIQSKLVPLVNEAQLGFINLEYLPGTLYIRANLNLEQKVVLDEVLNSISLEFDIPLVVDIVYNDVNVQEGIKPQISVAEGGKKDLNEEVQSSISNSKPSQGEATRASDSMSGVVSSSSLGLGQSLNPSFDFTITSVTVDPVAFVVLSTGERIFRGGLLPGGYIITDINLKSISLDRNGIKSTFTLK